MLGAEGAVGEVLPPPPSAQPSWRGTAATGRMQEAEAGLWARRLGSRSASTFCCLHGPA